MLNNDLENIPTTWNRIRGRKRLININDVANKIFKNLDCDVALTTAHSTVINKII